MRTVLISDILTMRKPLAQLAFIGVFIALFIGSVAVAGFFPFLFMTSLFTVDEQNGWERFRLTLPVTRSQVVRGRYLTVLASCVVSVVGAVALAVPFSWLSEAGLPVASVVPTEGTGIGELLLTTTVASAATALAVLLLASLSMPVYLRYGATKAARVAPAVVILAFCLGMATLEQVGVLAQWGPHVDAWLGGLAASGQGVPVALLATAAVLAVYAASSQVSCAIYERRQF
ncbi:ABC-2 transporter permease [Caniella muris]|uniref:ABC-2 transporter permease n=1 Tax=Caniella muris TaxID=2941502 RepID=UPI00203AF336|nr:ABC-2 transporter permease [Caniella muris]